MTLNVIGISAYSHDSACCLLQNGRLVAAAEEERFSLIKHDGDLPVRAFSFCLDYAGLSIGEIDCVGYFEDPVKKLHRQLWMGLPEVPLATPRALSKLDGNRPFREINTRLGYDGQIHVSEHHLSHAASSFFYSGYRDAALLTIDGVGEWTTTSYGIGGGDSVSLFQEVRYPHSIGLLYSALTAYLGFDVNDGEYKVMGLAPYGKPRYSEQLRQIVLHDTSGGFELDLRYFDFVDEATPFNSQLCDLLGGDPIPSGTEPTARSCDIARSLQVVLEEFVLRAAAYLYDRTRLSTLCLAGGVALNCVANERLKRDGPFSDIFVQPASNDAGGALGAAALAHVELSGQRPCSIAMPHTYFGPEYKNEYVRALFARSAVDVDDYTDRFDELCGEVCRHLAAGKTVGWFQGRMEFGPRALGARSILADPRRPEMRDRVNRVVKKRESFRPFAPVVLQHKAFEHFDVTGPEPFMTRTCQVISQLDLPAVTHVDGSARIQTVSAESNQRLFRLLETFDRHTGCPVLLNTSFNVRGEPIVCTPVDAIESFIKSGLDCLVLEDILVDRSALPESWYRRIAADMPSVRQPTHQHYTLL